MSPTYYEITAELAETNPRIWRKFLLNAGSSFGALHDALQDAFAWTNSHLHAFYSADREGEFIAGHDCSSDADVSIKDVALDSVFGGLSGDREMACYYEYDFGDSWLHYVTARKVSLDELFVRRLLDGAEQGPPEDCGGVFGYYDLLESAAAGDKEARRALAGRPGVFALEAAQRRFDRGLRGKRPALAPLARVDALDEVASLLASRLSAHPQLAQVIARAEQRWSELRALDALPSRRPSIWAAALEYESHRALDSSSQTQAMIAAFYGVSAVAISQLWRTIDALLCAPPPVAKRVAAGDHGAAYGGLIEERLEAESFDDDEIKRAMVLWHDFAAQTPELNRRVESYAAALHYIICALGVESHGRSTQQEVADSYSISAATLSQVVREITTTLNIKIQHWSRSTEPYKTLVRLAKLLPVSASSASISLDSALAAKVAKLAVSPGEVWELNIAPTAYGLTLMWASRQDTAVVELARLDVAGGEPNNQLIFDMFLQKMCAHSAQRRPSIVVAPHQGFNQHAVSLFAQLGITLETGETHQLSRLVSSMDRASQYEPDDDYIFSGVSREVLAAFFASAARLWVAAPWRHARDVQVIEARFKRESGCISIIGNLGTSIGLLLFDSLNDWQKLLAMPLDGRPRSILFMALEFNYAIALTPAERAMMDEHDLGIIALDAFPILSRMTTSGSKRPTERDYKKMTQTIDALLELLEQAPTLFTTKPTKPLVLAGTPTLIAPHNAAQSIWRRYRYTDHAWM